MPVVIVHPGSPATTAGGIMSVRPMAPQSQATFRLLAENENTMATESGLLLRTEQE